MTVRFVCGAIVAGLLTGGLVVTTAVRGHAQDVTTTVDQPKYSHQDTTTTADEPKGGHSHDATLQGCLQQGGKHGDKFILAANAAGNIVTSVTDPACTPSGSEQMIELEGVHKLGLDNSIGRWVEISGKLEGSSHKPEMRVRSFRQIPVVITKTVEVPVPAPPQAYNPPPAPAPEAPVATTGTMPTPEPEKKKLPKTASPLPLFMASTVMALMGALGFRLFRRRLEGEI